MPITFGPFGSYLGMFADKFGVQWMVDFTPKDNGQKVTDEKQRTPSVKHLQKEFLSTQLVYNQQPSTAARIIIIRKRSISTRR